MSRSCGNAGSASARAPRPPSQTIESSDTARTRIASHSMRARRGWMALRGDDLCRSGAAARREDEEADDGEHDLPDVDPENRRAREHQGDGECRNETDSDSGHAALL